MQMFAKESMYALPAQVHATPKTPWLSRESAKMGSHQFDEAAIASRPAPNFKKDEPINALHGLIASHHGHDKFSFHIFENEKGYLIDFPNDTTRIRPELLVQLKKLIGEESWRVEEITFQ